MQTQVLCRFNKNFCRNHDKAPQESRPLVILSTFSRKNYSGYHAVSWRHNTNTGWFFLWICSRLCTAKRGKKEPKWENGPCRAEVFHIIHRLFHREKGENPCKTKALQGRMGSRRTVFTGLVENPKRFTEQHFRSSFGRKRHGSFRPRCRGRGGWPPRSAPGCR